ncbi:MAG TPA: hypothetical protein DDW52_14310 [Planctomycetaceae bacterium]|nr:hypothetical protein [Planctomycetaceae bacterium]
MKSPKPKKQARKVRRQQRVRQLMFEKSEPRLMLNADWHNPFEARDVNADAQISPSDALSVINTLNSEGSRPLGATAVTDPFFDVSNDGFVSPIDALIVINHLNSIGSSIVDDVLPEAKDAIDSVRLIPINEFADQNRLSFRVEHHFSAPLSQTLVDDTFSVYVVSEGDPSRTLLHRSEPGDSVFALHSTGFEIVAGISSWDDQYLTIDLSRVDPAEEPALLFQFMNGDSHVRSMVRTSEFSFDSLGNADQGSLLAPVRTEQSGGPVQVDNLSATSDVELVIENESYDSNSDKYYADLSLFNFGVGTGREVVVTFDGIPEGASLTNASGFTPSGLPYINFENAISSGGLQSLTGSSSVSIEIDNPGGDFLKVSTVVLGGVNKAPKLAPLSPVVISPGASEKVQFQATDDDGDDLRFTLQTPTTEPPGGYLNGSGELLLKPTPEDVGSYEFVVTVSDGVATASQTLRVDVVEDPVTSTRVSGKILDTSEQPLSGLQVEIGNVVTTTDNNGGFVLDLGSGPLFSDTLRIRGDLASGSDPYPFIAEKLPYMFGREVIPGVNNVIDRPIYLPVLDIANAVQIDPTSRTIVDTEAIPSATVTVEAGNLVNQQGLPFEGRVSITEVPIDRTPAALPPNLIPDMVVTIQPGEMRFNQPAPLTLPNRGGYEPGTAMALWSIDPTTGEFQQVGDGEVSSDGERIETTVDGIRNSSWHFFVPPPEVIVPPAEKTQNQKQGCASCEAAEETTSQIELHSGALRETHTTLAYRSLGQDRAVTLHYNSQHAAPQPIVHFGVDNAVYRENRLLAARLSFQSGDFIKQVPGFSGGGLAGDGYHFWAIPEDGGNIEAALQGNLSDFPSGIYSYTLNQGFLTRTGDTFSGTLVESRGEVVSVNTSGSPFGVGWEIGGVQRIVSSPTGKLLLIDGNGSTLVFEPGADANSPYVSPPGDFTTLVRNDDFTFTRTTKEQTVFEFNSSGHLESITDRNGNKTQHVYNGGILTAIVDPVGLETRFVYEQDRIESIVGPGGRTAQLSYDDDGNLSKIVDPDGSSRTFSYDSNHQLVQEIDKRGSVERTRYGFHGRAIEARRKDGSILSVLPLQAGVLHSPAQTSNPQNAPVANVASDDLFARMATARGDVELTQLDQQGQNFRSRDSLGPLGEVVRDEQNLVVQSVDPRGFSTFYEHDERGNITRIEDDLIRSNRLDFEFLPEETFFTSQTIQTVHLVDLNGDQFPEAVVAPRTGSQLEIYRNFNGNFSSQSVIDTSRSANVLSSGDFDADGFVDIVYASTSRSTLTIHLGDSGGNS